MIVIYGNLLALITCSLPQWKREKWAGGILRSDNVTCLTRGNGHPHVMVFVGSAGSVDLEICATASAIPCRETPVLSILLAVLWIGLLMNVAGLKQNAWFMVGVGGVGMLQNVYGAGRARSIDTTGFQLRKFARKPGIIGRRQDFKDDSDVDLEMTLQDLSPLSDWMTSLDD